MSFLSKLNKKLNKMFDGHVTAHEDNGCLVLSGQLSRWNDIVRAGMTAVPKNPYDGVVNEIICTGEKPLPVRMPKVQDDLLEKEKPDVLIIGGGVIGCAIARELSKYKLSIMLVDKESDLAVQTSGRNSGLVQSCADIKKDTLKYRLNKLGNRMFEEVCGELGVDFERCGHYLTHSNPLWQPFMFFSLLAWKLKGFRNVRLVAKDKLSESEPGLNRNFISALFFPDTGLVDPVDLTIAYAENAVQNGASIVFHTMVRGMTSENGIIKSVKTNRGTIHPKVVINAAGVFSEQIASLAGDRFFSIHPRKGTEIVLNKKFTAELVNTVIRSHVSSSAKRNKSKGGGVFRTINGNAFVGPDELETIHREDYSTNSISVSAMIKRHKHTVPGLDESQIVSYFSGIRAATYEEDFVICRGKSIANIIHVAGIQSPGLTASPAIGVEVAKMVINVFGEVPEAFLKTDFDPIRIKPPRPADMDDEARALLVESNSDYGIIVCACEEVSKGEIIHALNRNVPVKTIDGIKRRVRAGMGNCQGACCYPQIVETIATANRLRPRNIKKGGSGSDIVYGDSKDPSTYRTTGSVSPGRALPKDRELSKLEKEFRAQFSSRGRKEEAPTNNDEVV